MLFEDAKEISKTALWIVTKAPNSPDFVLTAKDVLEQIKGSKGIAHVLSMHIKKALATFMTHFPEMLSVIGPSIPKEYKTLAEATKGVAGSLAPKAAIEKENYHRQIMQMVRQKEILESITESNIFLATSYQEESRDVILKRLKLLSVVHKNQFHFDKSSPARMEFEKDICGRMDEAIRLYQEKLTLSEEISEVSRKIDNLDQRINVYKNALVVKTDPPRKSKELIKDSITQDELELTKTTKDLKEKERILALDRIELKRLDSSDEVIIWNPSFTYTCAGMFAWFDYADTNFDYNDKDQPFTTCNEKYDQSHVFPKSRLVNPALGEYKAVFNSWRG